MFIGDSATLVGTFTLGGNPQSLVGCQLTFNLRVSTTGKLVSYTTQASQVSISGNQATVNIPQSATAGSPAIVGSLSYEWVLTDATGAVTTTEQGTIPLLAHV